MSAGGGGGVRAGSSKKIDVYFWFYKRIIKLSHIKVKFLQIEFSFSPQLMAHALIYSILFYSRSGTLGKPSQHYFLVVLLVIYFILEQLGG